MWFEGDSESSDGGNQSAAANHDDGNAGGEQFGARAFGGARSARFQREQAAWTGQLLPPGELVSIPHVAGDPTVTERLLAALHRDGAVILERAVDMSTVSRLRAELATHIDHASPGTTEQLGTRTKRLGAVVARAGESCYPLVAHPVLMELCSAVLGRQALHLDAASLAQIRRGPHTLESAPPLVLAEEEAEMAWCMHLTQLIEVGHGSSVQPLHSDGGYCSYDFERKIEHTLSTMWALDDNWTDQGGATRLCVGSHQWPHHRLGYHEETVAAAMPAGSLLIFSSAMRHGAGANTSGRPRLGLNLDYNLAFLRQEEAQQLSNPAAISQHYPLYIRKLLNLPPAPSRPLNWACTLPPQRWNGHEGVAAVIAATTHAGSGRTWVQSQPSSVPRGGWRRRGAAFGAVVAVEQAEEAAAAEAEGKTVTAERVGPVTDTPPDTRWSGFQSSLSRWESLLPAVGQGILRLPWRDGDVTEACLDATSPVERILAALHRDGAVVLEQAVSTERCAALLEDLAPYLTEADGGEVGAVIARSSHSWFVRHPALMKVAEACVGRQVLDLDADALCRRMGGAAMQCSWLMHRAHVREGKEGRMRSSCSSVPFDFGGGFEIEIGAVWGLDGGERGGEGAVVQRIAVGSHRWARHRAADSSLQQEPSSSLCMEEVRLDPGSVMIYSGRLLRTEQRCATGAGGRVLDAGYRVGFLSETEPQYAANPPQLARHYPLGLQRMVGYDLMGATMGYFGDFQQCAPHRKSNRHHNLRFPVRSLRDLSIAGMYIPITT